VSTMILGITGLIQTVPSLALFAILVPWLGTEPRTAVLALFLYSLLPIVRNTATGLSGISPSLRESAAALGLDARARLFKVELPLASPTILAGIKVSAVINVGTANYRRVYWGRWFRPVHSNRLALSDNALILRGGIAAAVLADPGSATVRGRGPPAYSQGPKTPSPVTAWRARVPRASGSCDYCRTGIVPRRRAGRTPSRLCCRQLHGRGLAYSPI